MCASPRTALLQDRRAPGYTPPQVPFLATIPLPIITPPITRSSSMVSLPMSRVSSATLAPPSPSPERITSALRLNAGNYAAAMAAHHRPRHGAGPTPPETDPEPLGDALKLSCNPGLGIQSDAFYTTDGFRSYYAFEPRTASWPDRSMSPLNQKGFDPRIPRSMVSSPARKVQHLSKLAPAATPPHPPSESAFEDAAADFPGSRSAASCTDAHTSCHACSGTSTPACACTEPCRTWGSPIGGKV